MPSVFTHAAAALALGTAFRRPGPPARFWVAGALCAVVPDLDVLAVWAGVPFDHMFGHRGITHAPAFAAVLAAVVTWTAFRDPVWNGYRGRLWLYLFVVTTSHGLLDTLTDGGFGIAFLAPFNGTRYFSPWQPIPVSPISVSRFFTPRGVTILKGELLWVWLPAAMLAFACVWLRRRGNAGG